MRNYITNKLLSAITLIYVNIYFPLRLQYLRMKNKIKKSLENLYLYKELFKEIISITLAVLTGLLSVYFIALFVWNIKEIVK